MKQYSFASTLILALGLITVFATGSSFTSIKGGEGFEIYINSKLVVQKWGNNIDEVKTLNLDQRHVNDELVIKYHHCGKIGKQRTLALTDDKKKVLKSWTFGDGRDASNTMSCKVKEILEHQKKNRSSVVNLVYTSSELPKGRTLAAIERSDRGFAAR